MGVWVEVTTLVIPGVNDSDHELRQIAEFIRSVGPEVPWHVSQFYPTYKMVDRPETPVATLRRARETGLNAGLRYVYEGNIPGQGHENTLLPGVSHSADRAIRLCGSRESDQGRSLSGL